MRKSLIVIATILIGCISAYAESKYTVQTKFRGMKVIGPGAANVEFMIFGRPEWEIRFERMSGDTAMFSVDEQLFVRCCSYRLLLSIDDYREEWRIYVEDDPVEDPIYNRRFHPTQQPELEKQYTE